MFTHSDIVFQVLFVDPAKGAQKVSDRSPQAFNRVGVDLPDAIAIVIPRPLSARMTNDDMRPIHLVVPCPLIAVTRRLVAGVLLPVALQRLPVRAFANPQPTLAAAPTNRTHNRRAVLGVGPMAPFLVRAATRRICLVFVRFAFFPPRSETSHRFPYSDLSTASLAACDIHWLASACATCEHSVGRVRVLRPKSGCFPLGPPRARATPFAAAANDCPQRASHCTNCKQPHTLDTDNPPARAWYDETRGPGFSLRCMTDSGALSNESVFQSISGLLGR